MANNHGGKRDGAGRKKSNAPKFGEWIANEGDNPLPDIGQPVIVWKPLDDESIGIGLFLYPDDACAGRWTVNRYENTIMMTKNVTHWMPLPPPPTK